MGQKKSKKKLRKGIDRHLHRKRKTTKKEKYYKSKEKLDEELNSIIENVEKELAKSIQKAIDFGKRYNPIDLLNVVFIRNGITIPHLYHEWNNPGRIMDLEYAICLLAAFPYNDNKIDPSGNESQEFLDLIRIINDLTSTYLIFKEMLGKGTLTQEQRKLVALSRNRDLGCKGDSYPHHHEHLVKAILTPVDDFIYQHFHFHIEDLFNVLHKIQDKINENRSNMSVEFRKRHPIYQLFNESKKIAIERNITSEEGYKALLGDLVKKRDYSITQEENDEIFRDVSNLFEYIPENETERIILDFFSMEFGDNKEFLNNDKGLPAFPLIKKAIENTPFIRYKMRYYIHGFPTMHEYLIPIIENHIKNVDKTFFDDIYTYRRGIVIENLSIGYLKDLFQSYPVHSSLYYKDSKGNRCELDGLVIFDSDAIFVEAKAAVYSKSARRGAWESLKDTVNDILLEAGKQAIRAIKYVKESKKPVIFENNKGEPVINVNPSKIKRYHAVAVSRENLAILATQVKWLKQAKIFNLDDWIIPFFINDLRIISEIIELPTTFIKYLIGRREIFKCGNVVTVDELDFFMWFLKNELTELTSKRQGIIQFVGMTDDLDQYYFSEMGFNTRTTKKPTLGVKPRFKEIIRKIERKGDEGFSLVTVALLSLNSEDFLRLYDFLLKKVTFDEIAGGIVQFGDEKILTYLCIRSKEENPGRIRNARAMKYAHRGDFLIYLEYCIESDNWKFNILDYIWKKDEIQEQDALVKKYRQKIRDVNKGNRPKIEF